MITELRFFHAGMGNYVCANRVVSMINPFTACGRRILKTAKQSGTYLDCCHQRPMKTLLILDDGGVMGSCITAKTLARRANKEEPENPFEEKEEETDESDRSVGENLEAEDA